MDKLPSHLRVGWGEFSILMLSSLFTRSGKLLVYINKVSSIYRKCVDSSNKMFGREEFLEMIRKDMLIHH